MQSTLSHHSKRRFKVTYIFVCSLKPAGCIGYPTKKKVNLYRISLDTSAPDPNKMVPF